MVKIRQLYRDFIIKLQEAALTFGAGKRIQIMLEYIDIRPSDTLLDVGGNTGKIRGLCQKLQRGCSPGAKT
jgi:hypothetical protein